MSTTERQVITAETFKAVLGVEPRDDDLERCNCDKAGEPGHYQCGWCQKSRRPVFMCADCATGGHK